MCFLEFSKNECPFPALIVETKGLGLAQDLNLSSNTAGHVAFFQGKEGSTRNPNDDEADISVSMMFEQFALQKSATQFAQELRKDNPLHAEGSNDDATHDRT